MNSASMTLLEFLTPIRIIISRPNIHTAHWDDKLKFVYRIYDLFAGYLGLSASKRNEEYKPSK